MNQRKAMQHLREKSTVLRKRAAEWPWKRIAIYGGAGAVALLILVQLLYPGDRLTPFSYVDGIDLSGSTKADAVTQLDSIYAKHPVAIFMANDTKPVISPTLSELKASVNNEARIDKVNYPWYLRLVPTSLFWVGVHGLEAPKVTFNSTFQAYVDEKLMPNCQQEPVNATLKVAGEKLEVVPEVNGRSCEKTDVVASIQKIQPSANKETTVRVRAKVLPAAVTKNEAQRVVSTVSPRISGGVKLVANNETITVAASDLLSWLDFTPHDNTVDVVINGDRASEWLNKTVAGKVVLQPGTSYITTRDFTEISRRNGANGRALDIAATVASLQQVIRGELQQAVAATKVVPPKEEYTRTYSPSDTGLSAVMANYAKDHAGTYGVSMIELDGKKRRAEYNGDKQFVTASTYKLFVAYELLKQIDSGQRDWGSNADCFNKMISLSDNPCSENFLHSLGLSTITKDIQAIGLKSSTFMKSGGPFTTANDQALLLGMIATGQNFSNVNQQRLVSAMKGNVYRKGIPAGVQGTVADKVGFLNGLLHDSAIVYGPNGTYVLSIMTDGSSWGNIAELAKQIDELRAQ